jgi:lipopolysaccharide biosynthesis protein
MFAAIKGIVADLLRFFRIFSPAHRARIGVLRHFETRKCAQVTSSSQILRKETVSAKQSNTLVIFASFDVQSIVDEYVLNYLFELKKQLSADIVFVTTSEKLEDPEVQKLKLYCRSIVHRKNVSIDFGSWKVALDETPDWQEYETLIIANDSVYGPLADMNAVLNLADSAKPVIAGVTESLQYTRHLQSYFLVVNSKALHSDFFKKFWSEFKFYDSKKLIIQDYEIGLSRKAIKADIEVKALFPYEALSKKALQSEAGEYLSKKAKKQILNPTHHFWRALLREKNSLFIKIELVKKNPAKLPDLDRLESEIVSVSKYPYSLIENHLRRTANRSATTR